MTEHPHHPALLPTSNGLVCATPGCATLLAANAEICDECGGTTLYPLASLPALLCGWAGDRPVVFGLDPDHGMLVGRSSTDEPAPDIDLTRFPGSSAVHRRHVSLAANGRVWRVTQLGTNPTVIVGHQRQPLATGSTAELRHGDSVEIAGIRLTLVVRDSGSFT